MLLKLKRTSKQKGFRIIKTWIHGTKIIPVAIVLIMYSLLKTYLSISKRILYTWFVICKQVRAKQKRAKIQKVSRPWRMYSRYVRQHDRLWRHVSGFHNNDARCCELRGRCDTHGSREQVPHKTHGHLPYYEKQPHCVMNELPHLTPYCYCKVQIE